VIPDQINEYLAPITGEEKSMPFSPDEEYQTPLEFLEYLFGILLETGKDPIKDAASFRSRQAFYDTVQERVTYLLEVLMKNNKQGLWLLVDEIKKMGLSEKLELLTEEGKLYTVTAKVLTDNNIKFDPGKLENACSLAFLFYSNDNISEDLVVLVASALDNLEYLALCHYPEVVYLMLQHYGSN
jgi:hypothetical protein